MAKAQASRLQELPLHQSISVRWNRDAVIEACCKACKRRARNLHRKRGRYKLTLRDKRR